MKGIEKWLERHPIVSTFIAIGLALLLGLLLWFYPLPRTWMNWWLK